MIKLNFKRCIYFMMVLVSACQNNSINSIEPHENELLIADTGIIETNKTSINPDVFISNDTLFTLRIFKTVAKLKYSDSSGNSDSLKYVCAEIQKKDSTLILLEKYKTRSPASREHYLSLVLQDSIHYTIASWNMSESFGDYQRFYFPFDAFDEYQDSTQVTLEYPGWYDTDKITTTFRFTNFKKVIEELENPKSNARIAIKKW